MKAIIITIGDEILMGQILDTNSQYIARSLTDMGVEITEILSIPDKRDEIYETVEYAMSEADLIIVTGGLGPTKDDVTKKVLAEYFGSQLKMNEEVFARLEEMLKRRGLTMNEGTQNMLRKAILLEKIVKSTPIGTNAGKLGRCLKRGIEIGLSSFSGTGEITYYGERGKCKTPG